MPNEKKRAAVERAEQRLALPWKKQNEVLDGVHHPLLLACDFPSRLAGGACHFPSGLAGSSLYHRHSCSPLLVDSRVNALLFADFAVAPGTSITFGNLSTRNLSAEPGPLESINRLRGLIATPGPAQSGKFFNHTGREYPWYMSRGEEYIGRLGHCVLPERGDGRVDLSRLREPIGLGGRPND